MKPENKGMTNSVHTKKHITISLDNEVFIPLTQSVYVPGKIDDIDNVLVGVGTGYFVQKDIQGASEFFDRKVCFVFSYSMIRLNPLERMKRQLMILSIGTDASWKRSLVYAIGSNHDCLVP